jgi:hypothetical protein
MTTVGYTNTIMCNVSKTVNLMWNDFDAQNNFKFWIAFFYTALTYFNDYVLIW